MLHSEDVAIALKEMQLKKRYRKIFLLIDTCQAFTMLEEVKAPRIIMYASSLVGENSISYQFD